MALTGIATGPAGDVDEMVRACQRPFIWTIQVKDHNLAGDPNLGEAAVTVAVDGAGAQPVETDENGFVHLAFTPGDGVPAHTAAITHIANGWFGTASTPGNVGPYRYQSNGLLTGTWNLRVRVLDRPGADVGPARAPIHLAWGGQAADVTTGGGGGAYRKDAIPCETTYVISIPDDYGADLPNSTATGKIGRGEAFALGDEITRDGITISRNDQNTVTVRVDKHNVTVMVELVLKFSWKLRVFVKNGDLADVPNMADAPIRIAAAETDNTPRTSAEGAAYRKDNMTLGTAYTVSLQDALGANAARSTATIAVNTVPLDTSRGEATSNGVTGSRTEGNAIRLNVTTKNVEVVVTFIIKRVWTLNVSVKDKRPKGVEGDPIALRQVPIRIASPTATDNSRTTGADASAYSKNDMVVDAQYTISVPSGFGAIVARSTAAVSVADTPIVVDVGAPEVTQNNVSVSRPANNEVRLRVSKANTTVTVEFLMSYPTIFIAGEGEQWGYALGLARKYAKGDANAVRDRDLRPNGAAPATVLADLRKWVIASQYDITDAPTANLPSNLFVYRDANGPDGQFDVRNRQCWTDLRHDFDLFEAMVFNNPHPGYGVHKGTVFGLEDAGGRSFQQGSYICVHSMGWVDGDGNDRKLTAEQVTLFRNYRDGRGVPGRDMTMAANQRYFLQTDVGCIQDGTAMVPNFADDGNVALTTINNSFMPVDNTRTDAPDRRDTRFQDRVTHYRATINTIGLWQSILRCYRLNGLAALQVGGAMFINGGRNFNGQCRLGMALEGFVDRGNWAADAVYYANYLTNFTSNLFHPSHFHDVRFNPGEPNLNNANAYRLVRTA